MKKIIAISVMFVLIAGAAFAELSLGGGFQSHVYLLHSDADGPVAGSYGFDGILNATWSGENAGGKLSAGGPSANKYAFAWWKPIDQFKFKIGQDGDWPYGFCQIGDWGFTAEAKDADVTYGYGGDDDTYASTIKHAGWGFLGGFPGPGLFLDITPIPDLEINIGIPFDVTNRAAVLYSNSNIYLKYNIADIGTIRIGTDLSKDNEDADLVAKLGFAFYLSAVENLGAEIGATIDGVDHDVIGLALGLRYTADDFGVKLSYGMYVKNGDKDDKPLGVNIMPYYNLGSLTAFLNIGFTTTLGLDDTVVDFFINPYIKVPVSDGNFYAGFKFFQGGAPSGADKPDAVWSLPIGWQVYF